MVKYLVAFSLVLVCPANAEQTKEQQRVLVGLFGEIDGTAELCDFSYLPSFEEGFAAPSRSLINSDPSLKKAYLARKMEHTSSEFASSPDFCETALNLSGAETVFQRD